MRRKLLAELKKSLQENPVTALMGPRQCGKSTLALQLKEEMRAHFFDLEDPEIATAFLQPKLILEPLEGLIIVDEAQLQPDLFPVLRVLVDADRRSGIKRRFLLLGSASPCLGQGFSESLAGRIHLIRMDGFSLEEVGVMHRTALWLRGGFPESYLAHSTEHSFTWRRDFIETFLLRDLPSYGVRVPGPELRRLWIMCAHLQGQLLNLSELGRALSVSHSTVRRHLDILEQSYVIRLLQPWYENLGKRQRKSPKLYIRDPGVLHALLGIRTTETLQVHPKVGASWEGFAMEQTICALQADEAWFWQTQVGAELDLLLFIDGKRWGFEFKRTSSPKISKSMHIALADLKLEHLYVVYPGTNSFPMGEKISALALSDILNFSLVKRKRML